MRIRLLSFHSICLEYSKDDMIIHSWFHLFQHLCVCGSVHTAGPYVVQHPTLGCSSEAMLVTIAECNSAKALLDPTSAAVEKEDYAGAPKGCSRLEKKWFFNTHATGKIDGVSEPVCKPTAGESNG